MEFLEPKDFTKHCGEIEVSDCDKYYTDTELAIILKALHGYYRENPLYMPPYAIELAMYTGMRVSELSTLKWSDINDICISINKSAKHNRLKNEFSVGRLKPRNQEPIRLTDRLITYWHASSEYKKNMEFYVNGFSRMAMEVIPMQET